MPWRRKPNSRLHYWSTGRPADAKANGFKTILVYCVGPPDRDPRPRCWHNATVPLDRLPDWDWYDICAHLKCTKCGSVGWVDPRPNWGRSDQFQQGHLLKGRRNQMSVGGDDHQLMVTVAAMKLLLGRLYTYVYTIAKMRPEDVLAVHKQLRETLPNQALVRSADPVISDVLSDDVAREIDRILLGVEKEIAAAAARKRDPTERT